MFLEFRCAATLLVSDSLLRILDICAFGRSGGSQSLEPVGVIVDRALGDGLAMFSITVVVEYGTDGTVDGKLIENW